MAGDAQKQEQGTGAATYEIDWTDPSEIEDGDLSHFMGTQFRAAKERRRQWEMDAAKQLAWQEGDQDLNWRPHSTTLERVTDEVAEGVPLAYQHPVRVNMLKGVVQQRIAMLLGGRTSITNQAATQEADDIASSTVGVKLMRYMWHSGDNAIRKKIVWALWHLFGAGAIWIHPHWNAFAGEPEPFSPELAGDETDDERKLVIAAFQEYVADKLDKSVDSVAFGDDGNILLPPGAVDWEFRTGFDISEPEFTCGQDSPEWIIDSEWRSMEYLRFRYGDDAVSNLHPNNQSETYLNDYTRHYPRSKRSEEHTKHVRAELVQVHKLWRPVRPWSPVGVMVVMAGENVILRKGRNPYRHGEIPYIKMQELPSEHYRPASTVGNMMTLQSSRNDRRSLVNAAVHMGIAPKLVVEEGVDLPDNFMDDDDRFTTVPAGSLTSGKIKWLDPPKIATDVYRLDDIDRRDAEDVGQIHSSTQGRGESSQQSGKHAQLLQRADSRANTVAQEFIETALGQAGRQSLWLWHQFVPTKRKIVITGGEFETEVLVFQGSDLVSKSRKGRLPGPYSFNVRFRLSPEKSASEVVALIDIAVESGTWNPREVEADRMKIERMLAEYMPTDVDEDSRQRRNAAAEHATLLAKKTPLVRYGDDDARHIREHMRWTTEDEFKQASEKNAELAEAVKLHIYEHMVSESDKRFRQAQVDEETKAQLIDELRRTAPTAPGGGPPPTEGQPGPQLRAVPAAVPPTPGQPAAAAAG